MPDRGDRWQDIKAWRGEFAFNPSGDEESVRFVLGSFSAATFRLTTDRKTMRGDTAVWEGQMKHSFTPDLSAPGLLWAELGVPKGPAPFADWGRFRLSIDGRRLTLKLLDELDGSEEEAGALQWLPFPLRAKLPGPRPKAVSGALKRKAIASKLDKLIDITWHYSLKPRR